jgi:two-component system KDP operon response regulator KdpE
MAINALVIDDDPSVSNLLMLLLKGHGINIFPAESGKNGLELIHEVRPDIVIIDLMMPGMDGWQVCKEIRKVSNVPIIILSVLNDSGFIASALDAGADDYLVKPVTGSVIVAHINRLIRRAEAERTKKLIGTGPLHSANQLNNRV